VKDITVTSGEEALFSFNESVIGESEDIAIIGMAGRFPDAEDVSEFWRNLAEGRSSIGTLSESRMATLVEHLRHGGHAASDVQIRNMGYLTRIESFDHEFFRISSVEAVMMDPAHRIFLETAWHAFENAGYPRSKLKATRTGIYLGYTHTTHSYHSLLRDQLADYKGLALTGNLPSMAASRLAHMLDLKGPSLLIDTSCSSSLVAVYLACAGLKNDDCDYALAGGVKVVLNPLKGEGGDLGINSKRGSVRAFDDHADGTVGGEGCGIVLLKKLRKAQKDGDIIHAIIKGGAYNNDGNSIGITAPNASAQSDVLKKAWLNARIDPESIDYIESHGTGTRLGDPIEINGINNAFATFTSKKQFCGIGSLKTNIGHLDSAAGIASLLKVILALRNKAIPPTLGFEKPNREIDFINSPLYVNDKLRVWNTNNRRKVAGINSFGISGTNCHLVIEEAPKSVPTSLTFSYYVLPISAQNIVSLKKLIAEYGKQILHLEKDQVAQLAHTAALGRDHYRFRIAVVFKDKEELNRLIGEASSAADNEILQGACFFADNTSKTQSSKTEKTNEDFLNTLLKANDDSDELRSELIQLAQRYVQGGHVAWNRIYRGLKISKIELPLYPFQSIRCWPDKAPSESEPIKLFHGKMNRTKPDKFSVTELNRPDLVLKKLVSSWATLFGMDPDSVDAEKDFFELGLDSISIIQVKQLVKKEFGLELEINAFFEELSSFKSLAQFISDQTPRVDEEGATDTLASGDYETISAQIRQIEDQLKLIHRTLTNKAPEKKNLKKISASRELPTSFVGKDPFSLLNALAPTETSAVPPLENQELEIFIQRYCAKTAASKRNTQRYRYCFANNRNVSAYKKEFKELTYPIYATSAKGARFLDVDGNEFLDFASGFGVFLLGYNHPAVVTEVERQLKEGVFLGPLSPGTGEVAELITELTGAERVAFYNSGTEAVMVAIRLARSTTGKTKIVLFDGSYHGTYDGVLVQKDLSGNNGKGLPKSNGIPPSVVDDVIILEYGSSDSLKVIADNIHDLAAILVEPVQSRRPDFQPIEFLQALRRITKDNEVALIFDEIVTGFRVHPGGVQKLFDIQADLVTYGKVIGGGFPIGIVAGKASFMVGVDGGGDWSYGGSSEPIFDHRKSFVTGTFCHHPCSIAAAKGILKFLKSEGPTLQERLNTLTRDFAEELNDYFRKNNIPISVVYFGSQFIIKTGFDPRYMLYLLIDQGIYCWEGMTFYVGCAHTKKDLALLKNSLIRAAEILVEYQVISPRGIDLDGKPNSSSAQIKSASCTGEETQYHALSQAQLRLWLTDQTLTDRSVFNMTNAFLIDGDVNVTALKRSLQYLIDRHEILRTSFEIHDQAPKQRIRSCLPLAQIMEERRVEVELTDLPGFVFDFGNRPFDLKTCPLFRVGLFHLSEEKFLFIWNVHHIIFDGWSMEIMMSELLTLYKAYSSDTEPQLQPVTSQYKDYSNWETDRINSNVIDPHKTFWEAKFKDIPQLNLPTDFPRPKFKTFNGGNLRYNFDASTKRRIEQYSLEAKASTFMTLLTVVSATLFKYTDQYDVILGTTTAGRTAANTENQLGFFVNLLPVKLALSATDTFRTLSRKVKAELLECLSHQQYPFNNLVHDFASKHDPGRSPLFDVLVEMTTVDNNHSRLHADAEEMTIRGVEVESKFTQYDLSFRFSKLDYLTLEYNTDLYTKATAEKLLQAFVALLHNLIQLPDQTISSVDLVDKIQRDRITKQFNKPVTTNSTSESSIMQTLRLALHQYGDQPFVIDGLRQFNYRDLDRESTRVARYLQELPSWAAGSTVAIFMDRSFEFMCSVIGILKACGVFVPFDTNTPKEKLKLMIDDCCPIIVLTQSDQFLELLNLDSLNVALYNVSIATYNVPEGFMTAPISDNDIAYILYTSGTTGHPKGVSLTHGNLSNYITWANEYYFNGARGYHMPLFTSVAFDLTLTCIFSTILRGDTLTIFESNEVSEILRKIFSTESHLKAVKLTPSHLAVAKHLRLEETDIKKVICGGESLVDDHIGFLLELNKEIEIYNEYGPTETTVGSTIHKIDGSIRANIIGKPIKNTEVFILDKAYNVRPIGCYGELFIGGAGVAIGYINNPEITSEKFITLPHLSPHRLYATGDYGRWLDDGSIELLGRKDSQVKVNGNRIELEEIRNAFMRFLGIREAIILAENSEHSTLINAYVILEEDTSLDALEDFLSGYLPHFMIPANIYTVKVLPLTINGKLDVQKLKEIVSRQQGNGKHKTIPSESTAQAVAGIWEKILKYKPIYLEDRFFETGGNSLSATIMSSLISEQFKVSITVQDLLSNPSLKSLLETISDQRSMKSDETSDQSGSPIPPPTKPLADNRQWFEAEHHQKKEYLRFTLTGSTSFNTSVLTTVEKSSRKFVHQAIEELVWRHESLRTTFTEKNGIIYQVVHNPDDWKAPIEFIDLSEKSESQLNELAGNLVDTTRFDLGTGPLCKFILADCQPDDCYLLIIIHHSVSDAQSLEVIKEDFHKILEKVPTVKPNSEVMIFQLKDYTEWVNRLLDDSSYQKKIQAYIGHLRSSIERQYGSEKAHFSYQSALSSEITRLNPALQPDQHEQFFGFVVNLFPEKGSTYSFCIGFEMLNELKDISYKFGNTLFVTFLSAWILNDYKSNGSRQQRIYIPASTRTHQSFSKICGWLTSEIIFPFEIDEEIPFSDICKRVSEKIDSFMEFKFYPHEKLLRDLDTPLDVVAPVFLNYVTRRGIYLTDFKSSSGTNGTGHFPLKADIIEYDNGLFIDTHFNPRIHSASSIQKSYQNFSALLTSILQDARKPAALVNN
jgi:iturin family lipopeptide synthetase A